MFFSQNLTSLLIVEVRGQGGLPDQLYSGCQTSSLHPTTLTLREMHC
jgi:hypothetical protein